MIVSTTTDPHFLGAPAEDIFEATLRAVRHTTPRMLSFGIIADPGVDYPFWDTSPPLSVQLIKSGIGY